MHSRKVPVPKRFEKDILSLRCCNHQGPLHCIFSATSDTTKLCALHILCWSLWLSHHLRTFRRPAACRKLDCSVAACCHISMFFPRVQLGTQRSNIQPLHLNRWIFGGWMSVINQVMSVISIQIAKRNQFRHPTRPGAAGVGHLASCAARYR